MGGLSTSRRRPDLAKALAYASGAHGGRPPYDPVIMLKILVIHTANNLSDERTEFLINDRLPFMRFLGLGLSDRVPDARTIWLFRERLTRAGAIQMLFERFDAILRDAGYIAMSGQFIDSSLVAAPVQRTRRTKRTTSRPAELQQRGRTSPQSCGRRTATRDGRSSSPRPSRRRTARCHRSISPFLPSATRTTSRSTASAA